MLIDYLTFSVDVTPEVVVDFVKGLRPGPWTEQNIGRYGYTRTQRKGGVTIYTDRPDSDRALFEISGDGCRELEAAGMTEWPGFLGKMLDDRANFTRLDVALDDHDGVLHIGEIDRCCREGLVVSRYELAHPGEALNATTGRRAGRIITFGERGSATFVRIYDKALKQGVAGHWVRVEFEARKKKARALAKAIAKGGAVLVPSIVLGCLDFKERGPSDRRERWPTAPWWTQFLGTDRRFRLEIAPRDKSDDRAYRWLCRSVAPTFTRLYDGGRAQGLVSDLLAIGRPMLKLREERAVRSPRKPPGGTEKTH